MNREEFSVVAAAMNGRPQRLVTVDRANGTAFRDSINSDSDTSRRRFIRRVAETFGVEDDEMQWLHDAIVEAADEADAQADIAISSGDSDERKNQATQLVELASGAELFHDPAGDAFARFPVDEHWEVSRLSNRHFRRWLSRLFYLSLGKTASAQATQDALGVLEAKAIFEGHERSVHVRIAGHDGKIYIDLADDAWQVIEITATGWQVLAESPIIFRRAKTMLPLPVPVDGGSVDELRRFVHLGDDEWTLLVAWLLAALCPNGPYPVLDVQGEHGSGKSTVCRMARALVDPNTSPLRSEPRDARDLMIAANNGGVIALDNLSHVQPWFSDCLCRLSTGGGFSTRTLFENDEETVFEAKRPAIINGIDDVATRADLLDRCLLINLPRIEQADRRSEAAMWAEFSSAQPRILGGLLSAVSVALRNLRSTQLPSLPRMADFALWVTAAEPALGWESGRFMAAYAANQDAGNEMALEASPAGKAIFDFVDQVGNWSGTMTELLDALEQRVDQKTMSMKSWPKSSSALGTVVKRLAPNLRKAGISVNDERVGKRRKRVVALARQPEQSPEMLSAPSAPSATQNLSTNIEPSADRADSEWLLKDELPSAPADEFPAEIGEADGADRADSVLPRRSDGCATTPVRRSWSLCSGRLTPGEEQRRLEREQREANEKAIP